MSGSGKPIDPRVREYLDSLPKVERPTGLMAVARQMADATKRMENLRAKAILAGLSPDEAEACARRLAVATQATVEQAIEHVERHIREHGVLP